MWVGLLKLYIDKNDSKMHAEDARLAH